jgi:hypothetical protein
VRPYTLNRRKTIVLGIRCNSRTMQLSKNQSALRRIHVHTGRSLRNSLDLERHTRYRITLVGVPGIEPGTSSLSGMRSNQLSYTPDTVPSSPARPPHPRHAQDGGGNRNRTGDLMLAKHVLYQLSYAPKFCVTGRRSKQVRSASSTRLSVQKGCDPRLARVLFGRPLPAIRLSFALASYGELHLAEALRPGCSLERR